MSGFFAKKGSASPAPAEGGSGILKPTGRDVDAMVRALVRHAFDKQDEARHAVGDSLLEISKHEPQLVLSACMECILSSVMKGPKIDHGHRVTLHKIMSKVIADQRDNLDESFVEEIVSFAMNEMTASKDVISDLQGGASQTLVKLSQNYPEQVMEELMKKLQPGVLPHYFVMKSFGDVAMANPPAVVPKLKEVMPRILPTLGQIKHGHIRYIFAVSLGCMSEGIMLFFNSEDKSHIGSHTIDEYRSEVYTAFDMLYNRWLVDREDQVKLATAQALGPMSAVLAREQFEAMLPKVIQGLLLLYKKFNKPEDMLAVTQGLCRFLEVCVDDDSQSLHPHLTTVLSALHPLTCIPPSYESNASVKCHAELLRCHEVMGKTFCENIVNFLLEKMRAQNATARMGTLDILKHLITRLKEEMVPLKELVVSGVKQMVGEQDLSVKKSVANLLMVMGSEDFLIYEGGQSLVSFLVQQCALVEPAKGGDKKAAAAAGDIRQLKMMAERYLERFTTTVESMPTVLWPYLFEFVTPLQYTEAIPVVLKCLTTLAKTKYEAKDPSYSITWEAMVNLPKPQAILARLLVLLNAPLRNNMGARVLECLLAIGPCLHPNIGAMYAKAIPRMLKFLEAKQHTDEWSEATWEELSQRLFKETLECITEEEWLLVIVEELSVQFELYLKQPEMKKFVFRYIGLGLQKCTKKQTVRSKLDRMFSMLVHTNNVDKTGCAEGFGFAANSHFDITLEKLQHVLKNDCVRKSSGFFGLSKDKSEADVDIIKASAVLCFGHVIAGAPPNLIPSRVEVHVLQQHIIPLLPETKTVMRKDCTIRALDLIGKAVHPSNLGTADFVLKQRDEILAHLIVLTSPRDQGEITMEIRTMGIEACDTYISLQPPVNADVQRKLAETALKFNSLLASGAGEKQEKEAGQITTLLRRVADLLGSLLGMNPNLGCLMVLLEECEKWAYSAKNVEFRKRGMAMIMSVLNRTLELITEGAFSDEADHFVDIGTVLALLIPRCCDTEVSVRLKAFDGIEMALYIDYLIKTQGKGSDPPAQLEKIRELKADIRDDDVNSEVSTVWSLASILAEVVSAEELPGLLKKLLDRATDNETENFSAAVVVLNGILQSRGGEMAESVGEIVQGIIKNLDSASNEQTVNGNLHSFRTLATHHSEAVIEEILNIELPHTPNVIKCIQVLGKSKSLAAGLLDSLIDTVNNAKFTERMPDPKKKGAFVEAPALAPTAATCALGELFELPELLELVRGKLPILVPTLCMRFGTSIGVANGEATKYITETFKAFCTLLEETAILEELTENDLWDKLSEEDHTLTIAVITKTLIKDRAGAHGAIFDFLGTYVTCANDRQRAVAVTMIGVILEQCPKDDTTFVRNLINTLLARGADKVAAVRIQVMRGLGNIRAAGADDVNRYSTHILGSLLHGVEDADETVALEAMNSLARIFEVIDESNVGPMMVNLSIRIYHSFEKSNPGLRAAAFSLFGTLCRFGRTDAGQGFGDQIHSNLVGLILHARDDDRQVRTACQNALIEIGNFLQVPAVKDLFEAQKESGREYYDDFLKDFSELLLHHFPGNMALYITSCIDYFKSEWTSVKANSAIFSALLLRAVGPSSRNRVDSGSALHRELIVLLKDQSASVRTKTAKALSLLYQF